MRLAVLCAVVAALAAAQDGATVEGVVVNKATGAGIGGATVRFLAYFPSQASGIPTQPGSSTLAVVFKTDRYETIADESGAFRITGVKPGDYSASVEKSGYFSVDTELFVPLLGGRAKYHINAGGDPLRVRLELNPPASIRGRVLGGDGNPAQASVDLGKGRTVNTDAEGSFVFENLESGPYTLLARPKIVERVAKDEGSRTEVVPTYYPSVVEPAQAESIVVRPGAELSGYEIRLQSVPVYRVRGVVLNPDGQPAAKAVVELQARTAGGNRDQFFFLSGSSSRQSFSLRTGQVGLPEPEEPFVTGNDGAFEFASVRAGDWTIRAEGDPVWDSARQTDVSDVGSYAFSLGRGDPDDLKIQLATPFRLSGVAVLSDGSSAPSVQVAVSLYSETGRSGGGSMTDQGGVFRLDVIPGAHEIRADVLRGNYYADSILLGSTEVTTQKVELTPASPPIKIILKVAGSIRGTVEDADAGTVVLFPQGVTGIAYSASSDAGGAFVINGVPPGDYYAIALDHFDPRTMADTVRLRSLMPMATSVKVEQGSAVSVRLKVNHAAD
jgi:hypothetical protein